MTFEDSHCKIRGMAFHLRQIIFRSERTNCKGELQFPPLIIYFSKIITRSIELIEVYQGPPHTHLHGQGYSLCIFCLVAGYLALKASSLLSAQGGEMCENVHSGAISHRSSISTPSQRACYFSSFYFLAVLSVVIPRRQSIFHESFWLQPLMLLKVQRYKKLPYIIAFVCLP